MLAAEALATSQVFNGAWQLGTQVPPKQSQDVLSNPKQNGFGVTLNLKDVMLDICCIRSGVCCWCLLTCLVSISFSCSLSFVPGLFLEVWFPDCTVFTFCF